MTCSIRIGLAAFAILGMANGALALQSSKPNTQIQLQCSDKLGAKHLKKAEYKAEHDKCMSDPAGYQ